ncbi:MAG: exosome complex RNA-binding protein Csl4 [Conexivisphaerales archaeon]
MSVDSKPVVPGEKVGVIEEFSPSGLTYEKDGEIRSLVLGEAMYDKANRIISVKSVGLKSKIPKVGDIIEGVVEAITYSGPVVRIYSVNGREVSNDLSGSMRTRDIIGNPVRLGDVVRCVVTENINNTLWLAMNSQELGVLHTLCTICGANVTPLPPDKVKCTKCGFVDSRKMVGFKPFFSKKHFINKLDREERNRRFKFNSARKYR